MPARGHGVPIAKSAGHAGLHPTTPAGSPAIQSSNSQYGVSGRSPECLRRARSDLADQEQIDIVRYLSGILPSLVLGAVPGIVVGLLAEAWQTDG